MKYSNLTIRIDTAEFTNPVVDSACVSEVIITNDGEEVASEILMDYNRDEAIAWTGQWLADHMPLG